MIRCSDRDRFLRPVILLLAAILAMVVPTMAVVADDSPTKKPAARGDGTNKSANESDEERQARQTNERFVELLKKQPRPGTALERVYAFHMDRGTLGQFLSEQRAALSTGNDEGVSCLLVGLLESKQGNHREAEPAFRLAVSRRPDDPIASWLLGQSLLELQKPAEAADAFEKAIQRSPQRPDLPLIFQDLGRAYRRAGQPDKANAVWQRMAAQFPSDLRVKEQIASTLLEEGDLEEAANRFEELSKLHRDPYQKTQYAIKVADLKLQLGRRDEAIRDFESQLQTLDAESWLAREIRRRIDQSFLLNNDQAGLVTYYESWLASHPDDLETMANLAQALSLQGRAKDALTWYRKAVDKAPSSIPLRKALLSQLTRESLFDEAARNFEKLIQIDPNNPEHLREWGMLALHRDDQAVPERRSNAVRIWKRMIEQRPEDPGLFVQVAELIARADDTEQALAMYQRAVELNPEDPQYREYLGDYLQSLGRTKEAVEAWRKIAEGDKRNTANLIRLAEIYRAAGLPDDALAAMKAACELTPELLDHVKLARWLRDPEFGGGRQKADASLKQLELAEALAENDAERLLIQKERIQSLSAAGQLGDATRALQLRLQSIDEQQKSVPDFDALNTAAEWRTLAAYFEAGKQLPNAVEAARKSAELAPGVDASWSLIARLYEQTGRLADAVEAYRKLLPLQPRERTDSLQRIAILEQRLGRRTEALTAGKELLNIAPDNPEFVKFYSDLCFHFGERQEALSILRRSLRSGSADGPLLLATGRTLANQNELMEAMSLCWTAFDKSANVEEKTNAVMMLAELSLRANRLDDLIQRLEQHRQISGQEEDAAQCLATAFRVAGDLRSARRSLESLLTTNPRDSKLLLQLSHLSEEDGDLEAAVDYQRRANSLATSEEGDTRLASLLMKLGDLSEAEALWNRIAGDTAKPAEVIEAIDQLLAMESIESAREICDKRIAASPGDWEVLVRRGILEWRYGTPHAALDYFQKVLSLKLDPNQPSAMLSDKASHQNSSETTRRRRLPSTERLESVPQLGEAFHEESSSAWFGPKGEFFKPKDYGAARFVAIIGCYLSAQKMKSESAVLQQLATEATQGALQPVCDQLALELFVSEREPDRLFSDSDFQRFVPAARAGDLEAQAMFVELSTRRINVWEIDDEIESNLDNLGTTLFSEEQFQLLMSSVENLLAQKPEWLESLDAPTLFAVCRHQRQMEKFDTLTAKLMQPGHSVHQFSMGLDLALLKKSLDVPAALEAVSQLMRRLREGNEARSTQPWDQIFFEQCLPRLLTIARADRFQGDGNEDAEVDPGFQVLEWWLQARTVYLSEPAMRSSSEFERDAARLVIKQLASDSEKQTIGFEAMAQQEAFDIAARLGVKNHLASEECEFLTQLLAMMVQDTGEEEISAWLQARQKSSPPDQRGELELVQAVFYHLRDANEELLLHLVRAAEHWADDQLLRLVVALRLDDFNMKAESLELIRQLPDSDPLVLKCREMKTLELAKGLQQPELAKSAVARLAGMELDEPEFASVVRELKRQGLDDLRSQLEARRTQMKPSEIDPSPLAALDHYEHQGNMTAAVQVAQQLLRRSHQNSTPWRNTTRATPEQIRARAFKVLRETGELDKMIERQMAQLEKSPQSGRLQKTLLDFLEAAGRVEEADKLRSAWRRVQPGLSAKVMIEQAEDLIRTKQPQLAADQLLNVLREHPGDFWNEAADEQVFAVFTETNRLGELADAILTSDNGRTNSHSPTSALESLIRALLEKPENHEQAARLIQRYSDMYPAYTVYFMQVVESLPLWSSPELFSLLSRKYVPSSTTDLLKPQFAWPVDYEFRSIRLGFEPQAIHSGGNLKRLWDALKFSDERRMELEQTTINAMQTFPDWPAGNVILIVCALSVPENTLDQDRVEKLARDLCDPAKPAIPEAVAYNLTQLLRQRGERMTRIAMLLLEASLHRTPVNKIDLGMPAARTLLELYAEFGAKEKGIEFLHRTMLDSLAFNQNDSQSDHRETGSRIVAGRYFLSFGRPLLALQTLQGLTTEDEASFLVVAVDRGWTISNARRDLRAGDLSLLQTNAVRTMTAQEIAFELQRTSAAVDTGCKTSLNLATSVATANDPAKRSVECRLLTNAPAASRAEPESIAQISAAIVTSLEKEHADLSLIILGTAMLLKSGDNEATANVLTALSSSQAVCLSIEQSSEEPEADYQRRQLAIISLAALAALAENTSSTSIENESGHLMALCNHALASARYSRRQDMIAAILSQQLRFAEKSGDKDASERIQQELQKEESAVPAAASGSKPTASRPRASAEQTREQLKHELHKSLLKTAP